MPNGLLYLGGDFAVCGSVAASRLVLFDPSSSTFTPVIVDGVNGVNDSVYALVRVGSELYVGGSFTRAGSQRASGIVRFDGSQWHPLISNDQNGLGGWVFSLLFHDGLLYAGGLFTTGGGLSLNRIARWDGSDWDDLGGGMTGGALPQVEDLALDPGPPLSIYASGRFEQAGGSTVNSIARWDGTAWHPVIDMDGQVGLLSQAEAMTTADGDVIVSSTFLNAGGQSNSIRRFDGTDWQPVGSQAPSGLVQVLLSQGDNLFAGGAFTSAGGAPVNRLARFNGTGWSGLEDLEVGVDSTVRDLLFAGPNLIVAGRFDRAGGRPASRLARWDGERFFAVTQEQGLGIHGKVEAVADFQGETVVGGSFRSAGSVMVNNVARFDGVQWQPLGDGVDKEVQALLVEGDSLYAAGTFNNAGGLPAARVARWDGQDWHPLGDGFSSTVSALAWHDGALHAAGFFTASGESTVSRVARFDGSQWSALGAPGSEGTNGEVKALISYQGELIVGGTFTEAGGQPSQRLARWDGKSWSGFGSGADLAVEALAIYQDDLVIGGFFTSIDDQPIGRVARYNGQTWSSLGSQPLTGTVLTLDSAGRWMFAGGAIEVSSSGTDANLALFDGQEWQPIGDTQGHGADSQVNAVMTATPYNDELPPGLFAAGRFGQAGPHTAANLTYIVPRRNVLYQDRFESLNDG